MYKRKINSLNKVKNSKILIFSKNKISKKLNYDNKQSIEFYNNFLKNALDFYKFLNLFIRIFFLNYII